MGRFLGVFFGFMALAILAQFPSSAASLPGPERLAESGSVDAGSTAQGRLDDTLNSLKDSVARLTEENKRLTSDNTQAGLKLSALGGELKLERAQGVKLDAQIQALEPRYQIKMAELSSLEARSQQTVADLDGLKGQRIAAEDALKVKEVEDLALAARVDTLSRELPDIRAGLAPGEDHSAELEALRALQQAAQKDDDTCTAELDRVRGEWKELAVSINAGPGQLEVLAKDQAVIKSDMARRSEEVEALRQKLAVEVKASEEVLATISSEAAAKTGQEIQDLDARASQLEQEASEVEKAARMIRTPAMDAKLKKDEARFKELLARNRDLSMGLKNLQRSMVSMDKKKSALERELDQTRQY